MNTTFSKLCLAAILFCSMAARAQVNGIIKDNTDQQTIPGATILIAENGKGAVTNENGAYSFHDLTPGDYTLTITSTGYEKLTKKIKVPGKYNSTLKPDLLNLSEITVSAATTRPGENKMDMMAMQLQPVKPAQDLLRTVPGLFIAQHAGGGKAEQIFVRGTDNDHGTDFAIFFDDIPVNMPTHAHGQGYADMHFMIPEVIGRASFFNGPSFMISQD